MLDGKLVLSSQSIFVQVKPAQHGHTARAAGRALRIAFLKQDSLICHVVNPFYMASLLLLCYSYFFGRPYRLLFGSPPDIK